MAKATLAKTRVPAKTPPVKAVIAGKGDRTPAGKTPPPALEEPAAARTITLKDLAAGLMERQAMPKQQSAAIVEQVFGTSVDYLKPVIGFASTAWASLR